MRSFADGNGDGTGDLAGVRASCPTSRDLGVDALWFNPWYPSPMADGGYDVADYRAIDPAFGTLAEAEKLIAEARDLGIRTIVDIVPNHVSDAAPLVQRRPRRRPGQPRARALLVPPRPRRGRRTAAQRLALAVRRHRLDPPRPGRPPATGTCTSSTPRAARPQLGPPRRPPEHEDVLRFWFDRGVAGVRIDSAALLVKDPALPDLDPTAATRDHPYIDRDDLHDIYRSWRRIADAYDGPVLDRRGLAAGHRALRPLPAPRRAAHGLQLRLPHLPVGRPAGCAPPSTRRSPPTPRWAPPRPGSCATTTSPGP